jgi:nucleotide-binding universal stress UspA family protein
MMKSILIATDFSCHSKYTIEFVLNFLRDTQIACKILLVNTYMVQQTDPGQVILLNDELKQKSKLGLEQARKSASEINKNPNISIETSSHLGSLKYVILQLLGKEKVDLVAMGKNGGKHVDTISILLKQQACPLLITYIKEY